MVVARNVDDLLRGFFEHRLEDFWMESRTGRVEDHNVGVDVFPGKIFGRTGSEGTACGIETRNERGIS